MQYRLASNSQCNQAGLRPTNMLKTEMCPHSLFKLKLLFGKQGSPGGELGCLGRCGSPGWCFLGAHHVLFSGLGAEQYREQDQGLELREEDDKCSCQMMTGAQKKSQKPKHFGWAALLPAVVGDCFLYFARAFYLSAKD